MSADSGATLPAADGAGSGPLGMACGKVILLGEHAVVHGVPALAAGIERGAHARAFYLPEGPCELVVRGWDVHVREAEDGPLLARAFTELVRATRARLSESGASLLACRVEAGADLPPGGGLGCSAATGVAVARALDPLASAGEIAARVMAWERVFHGNPSGVDAAVSARGGCVYFERGAPLVALRLRAGVGLTLAVGSTGIASSTKSMVEAVATRLAREPSATRAVFERVRGLVRVARSAIEAGDMPGLGRALDDNQVALAELALSTPEIDSMCAIARREGALGAKLTGAGGGGSVIALVESAERGVGVVSAWQRAGFTGFVSRVRGAPESAAARRSEVTP